MQVSIQGSDLILTNQIAARQSCIKNDPLEGYPSAAWRASFADQAAE